MWLTKLWKREARAASSRQKPKAAAPASTEIPIIYLAKVAAAGTQIESIDPILLCSVAATTTTSNCTESGH